MKQSMIFCIILLLFFTGCKKFIPEGVMPSKLEKDIPYQSGKVYFKDERIELKYLAVQNYVKKDCEDIIFYFHGFNRTEYEWMEANGFGKMFYNVIKENAELRSFTVVSITIGGMYLFIDGAPEPFSADLESLFINKIVPYFKEKYSKSGNVYLIGHSLGGFNALMLGLRHADKFPAITVISPYVAPLSPFTPEFEQKGRELKMPEFQIKYLTMLLTNAFGTEKKWEEYNPFVLVKTQKNLPFISISDAKYDLPGFEWSVDNFSKELEERDALYSYCKSQGDHRTTCMKIFYDYLKYISAVKK
jgi:pimeloyl-ACP methyl ester carboxylesterase